MTTKRKKIYVLTVSTNFMQDHPRAGLPTLFKDMILSGDKIHTIRGGTHWQKVVIQVNNGSAILSIRYWSGMPYKSKQVEIMQLEKLGYQNFKIYKNGTMFIGKKKVERLKKIPLAHNDGLSFADFSDWFKLGTTYFKGGIIHFTDFRY